jgi:4-aminobutyrate aminotransferase
MGSIYKRAAKVLTPALTFDTKLAAVKSSGAEVTCDDGRTYLDLSCGTAVANAGYNPPRVVEAVKKQVDSFIHSGGVYYYESLARCGELLGEITPGDIDMFFFLNGGSEAVEGCLKLARYVSGKPGILCFQGAFHGRTLATVALSSSNAKYRNRYEPLPSGIYRVPFPYCYRCPYGQNEDSCGLECADAVEKVLLYEAWPEQLAAVIIEPIQGEGGVVPAPEKFMKRLAKICKDKGIFLIFDEVQTGMGRTCRWFAAEHYGVAPDIIAIAKGIASGFPLSAIGSTKEIMEKWSPGAHGTTFGGSPVSCAAAVATIETIREDKMLERADKISRHAMKRLKALMNKHKCIGDVRGKGYMLGVEFVKNRKTKEAAPEILTKLLDDCRRRNLIMIGCGVRGNVLRFYPPLCVTQEQIDRAINVIDECLA